MLRSIVNGVLSNRGGATRGGYGGGTGAGGMRRGTGMGGSRGAGMGTAVGLASRFLRRR